jgi:hypothetical protein
MHIFAYCLTAMAICTVVSTRCSAQSAKDVRGPSPLLAIENEPPPKLIVDLHFPNHWPWGGSSSNTGLKTYA